MTEMIGALGVDAAEFLGFKRSLGYDYSCNEWHLANICDFATRIYPDDDTLTRQVVVGWSAGRGSESAGSLARRISVIREFARYLVTIGKEAYILPQAFSPRTTRYEPHMFTRSEIAAFFNALDSGFRPTHCDPIRRRVAQSAFRLMYCCGLRPKEVFALTSAGVDLYAGSALIEQGKNRKDRRVFFDDGLRDYLACFDKAATAAVGPRTAFLPRTDGTHRRPSEISVWFRAIWDGLGIAGSADVRVRSYDLRHYFATRRIELWMEQGADIAGMQPYLMAYMGHTNFRETDYYIHRSEGIDLLMLRSMEDVASGLWTIPEGCCDEQD
jgi:integrase